MPYQYHGPVTHCYVDVHKIRLPVLVEESLLQLGASTAVV